MKKVYVFGDSVVAWNASVLANSQVDILGYIVSDNFYSKDDFLNKKVVKLSQISNKEFDYIIIASHHSDIVIEQIMNSGIDKNKIINFYDFVEMFDSRIATLRLIYDEIKMNNIQGNVAELGVYKGDFAKYINELFEDKKLYLYDTFEGFNNKDLSYENQEKFSESQEGEFCNKDIDLVLNKMKNKKNCIIRKGYFPESIVELDFEEQYSFVSLDVDLYKPIYEGLKYFYKRLSIGGYIMVHDYNNPKYRGVKKAVMDYCRDKIAYVPIGDLNGSVIIKKIK